MKYRLVTSGKKCCCDCTWKLELAQSEDGYDLIQIKRGLLADIDKMKLQPGEPAIVLDSKDFYIGCLDGKPIHINERTPSNMTPFTDSDIAEIIRQAESMI